MAYQFPYCPWDQFTALLVAGCQADDFPEPMTIQYLEGVIGGKAAEPLATTLSGCNLWKGRHAEPILKRLAKAYGTDKWEEVVKPWLAETYRPIKVNLLTCTRAALDDAFADQGATGSTMGKSSRFMLEAYRSAKLPLGRYVTQKVVTKVPIRRSRATAEAAVPPEPVAPTKPTAPPPATLPPLDKHAALLWVYPKGGSDKAIEGWHALMDHHLGAQPDA